MGAKKLVTRILNGVYLVGTGIALYGLASQPLISLTVNASIPGSVIQSIIEDATKKEKSQPQHQIYRVEIKREGGSSSEFNYLEMLSKVDLDGVFDGTSLSLPIKLPSLIEFTKIKKDKQPTFIGGVVKEAINGAKDSVINVLAVGFNRLVPEIAKIAAKELAIGPAIKDQIATSMGRTSDDPEVQAKLNAVNAEVDKLLDNVWAVFESDEDKKVSDVMDVVERSANDVFEALHEIDAEKFPAKMSFNNEELKGIEDGMTEMLKTAGLADEDGNIKNIDDALGMLLDILGDLLNGSSSSSTKLDTPVLTINGNQIEWQIIEGAKDYTVTLNGSEPITIGTNFLPCSELDAGTYVITVVANPTDETKSASEIARLEFEIDSEKNIHESTINQENYHKSTIKRGGSTENNDEKVKEMIDEFVTPLLDKLPLDEITDINLDKMIGMENATLYIYLGITLLAALPWLLFALVTIIRTIRKRKCWTKPWIVFFFAFLELILGAGLFFGLKYGIKLATPLLTFVPETYLPLLEGIDINFQMSCFYASIVYIAMIPLTIVYMIFAHGVKKEFKIYKKSKKFAKKIAKGKMEFSSVKEKFQEETRKILEEKYNMAV